jgi:hypothetical protein
VLKHAGNRTWQPECVVWVAGDDGAVAGLGLAAGLQIVFLEWAGFTLSGSPMFVTWKVSTAPYSSVTASRDVQHIVIFLVSDLGIHL